MYDRHSTFRNGFVMCLIEVCTHAKFPNYGTVGTCTNCKLTNQIKLHYDMGEQTNKNGGKPTIIL